MGPRIHRVKYSIHVRTILVNELQIPAGKRLSDDLVDSLPRLAEIPNNPFAKALSHLLRRHSMVGQVGIMKLDLLHDRPDGLPSF